MRQIGHLTAIVQQYKNIVIDDPKRLPAQISDVARKNPNGSFYDDFRGSYQMQNVVISIGDTVIKGEFRGSSKEIGGMLHLSGTANFGLRDKFRDPLDIGEFVSEEYAKIDEEIVATVSEILLKTGDAAVTMIDLAKK